MGCDPAAFRFYNQLIVRMKEEGYDIVNVGCESETEADGGKYAQIAVQVSKKVLRKECDYGILMCGTGQGMAMASNKVTGIRAVLCYDVLPAVLSKNDNNGNILCTGAWMMEKKGLDYTMAMIHAWLFSDYTGTHEDGMQALADLDQKEYEKGGES